MAHDLALPIVKSTQSACLADGKTKLDVTGEVHTQLHHQKTHFKLDALVVRNLDVELLAGMNFLEDNHIILDIPSSMLRIGSKSIAYTTRAPGLSINARMCSVLRAPCDQVILPGETTSLRVPPNFQDAVTIEPLPCASPEHSWPSPNFAMVNAGTVTIPNDTSNPIYLKKHQHVTSVIPTVEAAPYDVPAALTPTCSSTPPTGSFSSNIVVDPDSQLTTEQRAQFREIHSTYDSVFDPAIGLYNNASGHIEAEIRMGKTKPPKCKIRQPLYNEKKMAILQSKADELEALGVLAKPDEVGVSVDFVSPSFLVSKLTDSEVADSSVDHDEDPDNYRFVTSFVGIAKYSQPPPSRTTNQDRVLRFLAGWRFVIKTDMTKQFFQLAVRKSSMRYLGVATPYKGIRVYTRAAMGMPGSTEFLDELVYRVLGDLMHQGHVSKIADDLYIGADSVPSLLEAWSAVLTKFELNNLRLSAKKTVICPKQTTILGWIWSSGSITPSPHKTNPLASAPPPVTAKGLRSWIGAVKHLKSCIDRYSTLFAPFEAAVAGKDSIQHIEWTESLVSAFQTAQNALRRTRTITIPRPDDQLIIITDGASRDGGIGAVMFALRNGTRKLCGFFSMKLRPHHVRWLPCEVEALAITAAVQHWAGYITESSLSTQILTDSKPCVDAFSKLLRGEFSASARVGTFLTTLSRFRLTISHLSGSENGVADYLSRHPATCVDESCQICTFVRRQESAAVRTVIVADVLAGKSAMPFLSSNTWKATQQDCPDLRRTYAHLIQGTKPSKKDTRSKDIKHYVNVCTIDRNGLLVVKKDPAFSPNLRLIVIPKHLLHGFLTALHLRLSHPSKSQLKSVFGRYFYAYRSDQAITHVSESCDQCASLATVPNELPEFSTTPPPQHPGTLFSCDVMRRSKQYIFVARDSFSSFTAAALICGEDKSSLRDAIIETTSGMRSGRSITIRSDNASSFQSLVDDSALLKAGIRVELGRLKNPNKNPVVDKAIQELECELRESRSDGSKLSRADLALAIHVLNSRIRNRGLSANEILFQRDNVTGAQLQIDDSDLRDSQYSNRCDNHDPSARS